MKKEDTTATKVSEYWDKNMGKFIGSIEHWEGSDTILKHQFYRVTGSKDLNPINWFYDKYGPFSSMASIGSGTGILEKQLCGIKNSSASVTGHDISELSVKHAIENCAGYPNVFFKVADLNYFEWPEDEYDVVFAHGALHHIEDLEWCLGQIRKSQKIDGLLYVNDYVGPNRFQWTDIQMDYANRLLQSIPDAWKRLNKVSRCNPKDLQETDPSEAVCPSMIEYVVNKYFTLVERKPRGGTLLAPIFGSGCIDKNIMNSAEGIACLQRIAEEEGRHIDSGLIPSDHVVLIAEKR